MRLTLQQKFFYAFFSMSAVLVLLIAGAMHYIVRDGFGDYVAKVKVERLGFVQKVVVKHIETYGNLDLLKIEGTWEALVLAAEDVKREQRELQKERENQGAMDSPHERPPMHLLPPYVYGVALLDADGGFVAGESVGAEDSMRFPIFNLNKKIVAFWMVRKTPPENDALGQHFLREQLKWWLVLLAVSAVLSALLAWLWARYFRAPMATLQNGFKKVAAGDLTTRLPVLQGNEMGDIARNFNTMTAQLQAQETARRQWVADTSHELRTPLTILRMRSEAMRDGVIEVSDQEWGHNLSAIKNLTVLIDDLQAVARATEGGLDLKRSSIPLNSWLSSVVKDNDAAYNGSGLTLHFDDKTKGNVTVCADSQRLQQVLRNLLINSLRYTDAPGETLIELSVHGKFVRIEVLDSAPAVPKSALPCLFERFYRVEGSRNRATGGSGLGLAICEGIIKSHNGRIWADESRLGGLSVVIELPIEAQSKK